MNTSQTAAINRSAAAAWFQRSCSFRHVIKVKPAKTTGRDHLLHHLPPRTKVKGPPWSRWPMRLAGTSQRISEERNAPADEDDGDRQGCGSIRSP
ncbi:MAG: hypothetical protein IPG92_14280 [Flavobacteriales bacterium]|nr:hypothetical protein [Flavobacteriales bacterium]